MPQSTSVSRFGNKKLSSKGQRQSSTHGWEVKLFQSLVFMVSNF